MPFKHHKSVGFETLSTRDRKHLLWMMRKGASRRDVLNWLMAAGLTATTSGSIFLGAESAIAATPKRGGQIRFAWDQHGPADTINPLLLTSALDYVRARLGFNQLCRMQEDLTAGPELATEWQANATATEWTFKLRRGVEWHDGSRFAADDVVFSLNKHLGEDTPSKAKSLVGDVKQWIKLDDYTVRAEMKRPNAELPIVLGTFHFKIVKDGTADFTKPVGTGPFTLEEFTPGIRSVHNRNDSYWNDEAGPYLDRVECFAITDSVARTNALISGDVQMIGNLNPRAVAQVEASDGVEVFTLASGAYTDIVARYVDSPAGVDHLDFLKGLKHLQRRDRILNVVQKGAGSIGNDQPIGSAYGASWCEEANDPVMHPYDPDKAKHYLKKAAVTSAELKVAEVGPGLTDICLMMQRECQKVGFDLKVTKVPNDGYWGAVWNKVPMFVSTWNMKASANIMMTLAYKSDAAWNESGWGDERFDKLLVEARGELDAAKRYEMNCEMQRICADKSGTLIATHRAYIDAKAKNVKGLPKVPLATTGGAEWPEFIWIDA